MKKLSLTISVALLISACGGGGYGSSPSPYNTPTTPNVQGLVPEQIDPVQTTVN